MNKSTYQTSHFRIVNEKINLSNYYYFLIIVIVAFILMINTPYKTSYDYILIKSEGYKLIVDDNYFPIKSKYLYFNHKKYAYSVIDISEPYITDNKKYYDINVDLTINDFKEDKNVFNVSIVKGKSTMLKDFLKKLKKG